LDLYGLNVSASRVHPILDLYGLLRRSIKESHVDVEQEYPS
jgi:hypothetical protein